MSLVSDVLGFVTSNWELIITAVYGLLSVANAVTSMTPSTDDDSVVAKVKSVVDKVVDFLSFLSKKDAVGTMKMPLTMSKK